MRMMTKSSSMPTFSQRGVQGGIASKPRKHKLQQLENQVNKSRIAIENMSHTRAIEGVLYIRVEELQKELHRCIMSLNQESQKHKILQSLTNILKGQMSAVKAVQRTSEEFVSCGIEKKVKKVEYDIKQIEHKFNQEIAKINWLKEQANASRDERVVYSNLFNKIEKQIKHYQEIYKQALIKNQIFLDKKRSKSLKNSQQYLQADIIDQSVDRYQKIDFNQVSQNRNSSQKQFKSRYKISSKSQQRKPQVDPFLTSPKEITCKRLNQSAYRQTMSTGPKTSAQHKAIQATIRQRQANIEAVIVHSQCRSQDEAFKLYSSLGSQNQNLIKEISQLDQNIDLTETQTDRLIKQKRSSQVYENRQLVQMVNISKKSRINKAAIHDTSESSSQNLQNLTMKICQLVGVDCQNLANDVLRQLDKKIEDLGCSVIKKQTRRESRSGQDMCDRGVGEILDKIDRFGESQKIFDKNMLRAEYHKELTKVRKRAKKTN